MEQVSKQDEARAHRESARQIRAHLAAYGSVLGMGRPEHWESVARRKEELADALELPALSRAS
jgi:hypothetical protein